MGVGQGQVAESGGIERGILLMTVGVLSAPIIHAMAKGLGASMATGQVAWGRYAFQLLVLLPVILFLRQGRLSPPSPADALRGLLLAVATLSFFGALAFMPLAESSAIFFVEPLILTLLSAAFLGERIGWRRCLAVVVGFLGALIVIRPSFEEVGPAALLPLVAAACFAVFLTITRHRAGQEDGRAMQFWVCAFATLSLSLALILGAQGDWSALQPSWPTSTEWLWLAAMGLLSTVVQFLAIQAFRLAPASLLAPFQYLEIVGATLLGVMIFNDLPDAMTVLGVAVIVGSGLYVFWRERSLARRRPDGPPSAGSRT